MTFKPLEQIVGLGRQLQTFAHAGQQLPETIRSMSALKKLVDAVPLRQPWADNQPTAPRQ